MAVQDATARVVWTAATRTLASGTPGAATTRAEEIAAAVWTYGTRTTRQSVDLTESGVLTFQQVTATALIALGIPTIASTATLTAPAIAVGDVAVVEPTLASGAQLFSPSVALTVLTATIGGASTLPTPLAYWALDEGSGTVAADGSGHGQTGTVDLTDAQWIAGEFGSGLEKVGAGTAALMTFTPITVGSLLTSTVAVWLHDAHLGGIVVGGAAGHYGFYIDAGAGDLYFSVASGGVFAGPVAHGTLSGWHHLAVTRSGNSVWFYKDGSPLGTVQTLSTNVGGPTLSRISGYEDGSNALASGVGIDELRIYDELFSDADVAELAALDPTASGGATLSAPTVALDTGQSVTGETVAGTSALTAPTLAYAVTSDAIASTVQVTAPTVALTVEGDTIASTESLTAPTVATGAVTVAGETCASTLQLFAPTCALALLSPTITTTATLTAPDLALTVLAPTMTSLATLSAPTLAGTVRATTMGSTQTLFAPTSVAITAVHGLTWGAEVADNAVPWTSWQTAPGVPALVLGDAEWGKVAITGTVYGPVTDTGSASGKTFALARDQYDAGSGSVTLALRGATTLFAMHDDESSVAWEVVTDEIYRVWRYVQIRMS